MSIPSEAGGPNGRPCRSVPRKRQRPDKGTTLFRRRTERSARTWPYTVRKRSTHTAGTQVRIGRRTRTTRLVNFVCEKRALPCRNSRYRHDRKKTFPLSGKRCTTNPYADREKGNGPSVRHDIGNERNRTPVGIRLCGPDRRFRNGGRKVSRLRDRGNGRSRSRRLRSRLRRGVCRSRGRNRASGPSVRNAPRARRDR